VPAHPLESVAAPGDRLVDLLEQLDVLHGLAVALAPALFLPAGHPLGHRIDDVLAVAEDEQVFARVVRGAEQFEHRRELALVVGRAWPATRGPVVFVDVPRPARRARVAEGRAVCGCGDRHARTPWVEVNRSELRRPRASDARGGSPASPPASRMVSCPAL